MASTGKRNGDNEGDCLKMKFMEKPPHFFKVILDRTLQEGKLRIPKKFARKYGKSMRSPVLLNVPGGVLWQVELKNSDGAVWLEDGWKEFAERYSISCGHFLVFRYEGNDQFHVLIFDKSASEIEYPDTSRPGGNPNFQGQVPGSDEGKTKDDTPIVIPDDVSPSKKTKGRTLGPGCMLHKKMRSCSDNIPKSRSSTSDAAEAASKFVSKNPFFTVRVPGSEFQYSYPSIPGAFYKEHIKASMKAVKLEVSGRFWPVKIKHYSNPSNTRFSAGWFSFCKENNLQVGDICVFELIRKGDTLMKVSIFPAAAA